VLVAEVIKVDPQVWYDLAEGVWFLVVFVPGALLLDALADWWSAPTPAHSRRVKRVLFCTGLMAAVGAFVRFVVFPTILSL